MKVLGAIVVFAVIMAALFLGFIYSGMYNIAATVPHTAFGRWLLQTTMEQSVRRHAEGIASPRLTDPVEIEGGFRSYREMCVTCHGAPGVSPSEIGKGLTPEPPDLAEQAQR
jgi:mono/diheme cytochrome c family protein